MLADFLSKKIVVIDTCVCRALIRKEESPWFDDFCKMGKDGVEFCISDVSLVELTRQFHDGGISSDEWTYMLEKIKIFISKTFPILPGKKQLFQMAEIIDKDCPVEPFNFKRETAYSRGSFDLACRCQNIDDLKKETVEIFSSSERQMCSIQTKNLYSILQDERSGWSEHIKDVSQQIKDGRNSIAEEMGISPDEMKKINRNKGFNNKLQRAEMTSLVDEMNQNLGEVIISSPSFCTRADLLIKVLAKIASRAAMATEPYNPKSSKKENDGLDFLILLALILPARVCSKDGLKMTNEIESYQREWIVTPETLVEMWKTGTLNKLNWPSEDNDINLEKRPDSK